MAQVFATGPSRDFVSCIVELVVNLVDGNEPIFAVEEVVGSVAAESIFT